MTLLRQAMAEFSDAFENRLDRILYPENAAQDTIVAAMRYASLEGGKRLRPFLVQQSSSLFDVQPEQAYRVGLAIELLHCYSLVHDDLPAMDDDDLRRGRPTTHRQFDEATAILAGDALLTYAFEILAAFETHDDPSIRCELVLELAKAAGAKGMVGGQMLDLEAEAIKDETQKNDYDAIARLQRLKTGRLIDFAAQAGAILGRAYPEERKALSGYSHDVGLAFQIIDDLLDVEGTEEEMGKAVGKDADKGKATFVSILGPEKARARAELLTEQAINHLAIFDHRANLLREIAQFVIDRKA